MINTKKTAVLILGAPRSGTSAVSSAVEAMGFNFGDSDRFVDPQVHTHNPKFYELKSLNVLNDKILSLFNSSFFEADFLARKIDFTDEIKRRFLPDISELISQEVGDSEHIGLKDPRFCFTLPLWLTALRELNFSVVLIRAARNLESCEKSNLLLDPSRGTRLARLANAAADYFLEGEIHLVVDYDDFINNTSNVLLTISNHLGLQQSDIELISKRIDGTLRHNFTGPSISPTQKTYFDHSRVPKDSYKDLCEALDFFHINPKRLGQERLISSIRDGHAREAAVLTEQIIALTDQVTSLNDQAGTLTGQIGGLNVEKAALAGTVNELLHSTSWKVTAPLRSVGTRFQQLRRLRSAIAARGGLVAGLKQARRVFKRGGIAGVVQGLRLTVNPTVLYASGPESFDRNDYARWIRQYDTLTDGDRASIRREISQWENPPLISVVMPTFNTPIKFLKLAVESVQKQLYPHWELCIADDCSTKPEVIEYLHSIKESDSRIKVVFRQTNGHISAASNSALELVTGSWVALLDHDDELAEHALFCIAQEIIIHPDAMLIYSDEDKIDEERNRFSPHFKGDWNPDLILSLNYFSHLGAYKTEILQAVQGFRIGYEGSQDHDLVLRCSNKIDFSTIRHIPRVLYHWRAIRGSTALDSSQKCYATTARLAALEDHLIRNSTAAKATLTEEFSFGKISYEIPNNPPLVSLLIPTRDRLELIETCVRSILEKSDYKNIEIIIIDNDSSDAATLQFFEAIQTEDPRVRVISFEGCFNFSAINNYGVDNCRGSIIGLINNDVEVINADWLSHMVGHVIRPEIGCVGAKLYYPNETIQHAGIALSLLGLAGHVHRSFGRNHGGYFGRLVSTQTISAVTAACLLVRKEIYRAAGGLNSNDLAVAFNDVDFCLKVKKLGYLNLWTPFAELYHHESVSRGYEDTAEKKIRFAKEVAYMKKVWANELIADPYYNPNLTVDHEDFSLAWPPRVSPLTRLARGRGA